MRFFVILVLITIQVSFATAQKLKVDQIIQKHIEAAGSKDLFTGGIDRAASGVAAFSSKQPTRAADGKVMLASDNSNYMFHMSLVSQEYPQERIGFFNNKIEIPWVTPGTRSPLGAFLLDHTKVMTDGLFGGTFNGAWALANLDKTKARVRSSGPRKVDGNDVYIIDYFPRGNSSEFSIKIFIDSTNFQHLRTEYFRNINPQQGVFGQASEQTGVRIRLTENFSDHKEVNGVTLPYKYTIKYLTDSNTGAYEYDWTINIEEHRQNAEFAPDFFSF